ncbi:MAG: hypothetical protein M4579_005584 [Chaenotheca gracillima]|nr:MAG: hypothetical protein M4579_005584 [Chaenotheca gracillima]
MSTAQAHNDANNVPAVEKEHGIGSADHANNHGHHGQKKPYDYGGNPLAHVHTGDSARLPAFGGEFQPGLYRPQRKLANPAPMGLCGFALTTFLLSLINMGTLEIGEANLVVGAAYAYGGLVQLLAGMWEVACGNTFGATAFASYGGFWIAFGIIETGGFGIVEGLGGAEASPFLDSFGLFLMGWFIFTFILLICTLRSTVAFFTLFFWLDLAFLLLGIGYLRNSGGAPNEACIKAGGFFGLLAAFTAWYNALAGIADSSNSFFVIPVAHFPWSEKGRERRGKTERETV